MVDHLSHILQEESIPFEPTALPWIAQAADGSVRDALSLLDQAIAQGQSHVLESNIREMLGYLETHYITQLIDALIEKSGSKILSISTDLQRQGTNCTDVLRELQRLFHQIAVIQCVPEYNEHDLYSTKVIKDFATKISREDLQLFYQIALKGFQDLSLTPTPWMAFEMILLRMLAFQPAGEDQGTLTSVSVVNTLAENPPCAPPASSAGQALYKGGNPSLSPSEERQTKPVARESIKTISEIKNPIASNLIPNPPQNNNEGIPPFTKSLPRTGCGGGAGGILNQSTNTPPTWDTLLPALKLTGLANTAAQHCTFTMLDRKSVV
jgi:DNA polymerase-3 subunit gamma/tau